LAPLIIIIKVIELVFVVVVVGIVIKVKVIFGIIGSNKSRGYFCYN